jgi:hypothetical protein
MSKKRTSGAVLSVDLARRSYKDLGFALLPSRKRQVKILSPSDLGLEGRPETGELALSLANFSDQEGVSVLLLDGPQGWRHPKSPIEHMRLCERVLNTPGKTGVLGTCKPRTYLAYIQFSIDLFRHLRVDHGWELLTQDWHDQPGTKWVVESFPSAAWTTLGLKKLPSKGKTKSSQIRTWSRDLSLVTGLELPKKLTHDELQAAVVLPVGQAIARNRKNRVILSGYDPILTSDGVVLEGWIANPRLT